MLDLIRAALDDVLPRVADARREEAAAAVLAAVEEASRLELHDSLARAIAEARGAGGITDRDEPTCTAALQLARRIDMSDAYFEALSRYAADNRLRPPSQDNVSLPTFLKYMGALGLTPESRKAVAASSKEEAPRGELDKLRDEVQGLGGSAKG